MAGRKQLDFSPRSAPYFVAEPANIDSVLFAPVMAHYWTQKELKDGTYSYIDLLNILEMMKVEKENRWRDFEYCESQRRARMIYG